MNPGPVQPVAVLGVQVSRIDWPGLVQAVGSAIETEGSLTLAYANVHVLNLAQTDPVLRAFLNAADHCYCDGSGVRLGARMLGGSLPARMTGADWIWDLAQQAEQRGWRLAWVGGRPGVSQAAADTLTASHPGLVVHCEHGYHPKSGPENQALIGRLRAFAPDILLVGMGSPTQEHWVAAHRAALDLPVVWCLGATADFVAGSVPRPGPAWLLRHAEWLSRLWAEPRRLGRRYLVGNPMFLARVLRQRLGAQPPSR